MIRIISISPASPQYKEPQEQSDKAGTRFYNNQVTKEQVKDDFGIVLDKEIARLHIDIII